MTDKLIALAAMNSALQAEAFLAALGSTGTFTDTFWSNLHTCDIPYANGATLGSAASIGEHLAAVERLTASRAPNTRTYIMDSRAALDLAPLGYEVRFTDEWFVRTGPVETAPAVEAEGVKIIRTAEELAEYEMGDVIGFGGISPGTPGHTYGAELLADERFTFYGMYQEGRLASGVFLFRDPRCLGVYAFFTLPEYRGRGLGTSLLQHVLSETPNVLLATNPSAMSRGIFTKLGFRAVGERRIWERATT